jgi:hypothetical protein
MGKSEFHNYKRSTGRSAKLYPEELREYIKNNPDKTLKEIGAAFGASDASIRSRIRQLRITYKKIILYKERDEEKRRAFTKFINQKQVKDLVFVDECGINH